MGVLTKSNVIPTNSIKEEKEVMRRLSQTHRASIKSIENLKKLPPVNVKRRDGVWKTV